MNRKGFTMVELLVVLLIVGILAAIATPLFLAHTKRAKASEAVAIMSQIRQSMRDYTINHPGEYYAIAANNIQNPPPPASNPGVEVDAGVAQYFSNAAFTVVASPQTSGATTIDWEGPGGTLVGNPTNAVDFLIKVDGSASVVCASGATNCAVHYSDVSAYRLRMDNSGRIFVMYDYAAGTGGGPSTGTWQAW